MSPGTFATQSYSTSSMVSPTSRDDLILFYESRIKELEFENAELRRKQIDIEAAKKLYLKIFEDFPALIWRSRTDKLCDYFNRTWLEWTGKSMDEEFGNGWTKGVHKDDFDRCLETYVNAFDKREAFYMEYRLLDKHGDFRWIGDHGRPFHDLDGTFLGYIGSCYDITEKWEYEQKLLKLNETKDKFFSIVAHDLRNPIATFVTVSELLMENHNTFDEEEMTEIATEMHKDAQNTLLLLENLLDWSRTQSDHISFRPEDVDLQDLCKEVVAQVDLCAKAKKIHINYDLPVNELKASADKNMIKTVVRNLLMNAIKFTHHGGFINLKTEYLDEAKDSAILFTIEDHGVGISEKEISTMFEIPVKKSRLGTASEGGSGLGLVICKEFVDKHHGKIWVESELGNGAEFKFTIPPACERVA